MAFLGADFEARRMQGRLGRLIRKGLGAFACVAMVAAAVRAANNADRVEIEIPMFSGGFGTAFFEETARLFEKERPGVRVRLYGDPRIEDKVRVRAIDGSYPDGAFAPRLLWPALVAYPLDPDHHQRECGEYRLDHDDVAGIDPGVDHRIAFDLKRVVSPR